MTGAPRKEHEDGREMMRTLALGAAWLMGCGLAIIVGGPWWQRLLIIAVVFMAHLGGRWTE